MPGMSPRQQVSLQLEVPMQTLRSRFFLEDTQLLYHVAPWFRGALGTPGVKVGLDNLKGHSSSCLVQLFLHFFTSFFSTSLLQV